MTARNQELLERLAKFGERIIKLCQKLSLTPVNKPLINQVVKSGSSMGANYSEACDAESSNDFVHKIKIVLKEGRETKFHLRLIASANPAFSNEITLLGQEADEYVRIFSTIISKFSKKMSVY